MRVLVTGGAGYIGSVVVEELIREGHEVVVYDSLVTGHRDAVPPGVPLVCADLLDEAALTEALRGCAAVVHMAAHSQVGESVREPLRYYRNNVEGGLSLLRAMGAAGTGALVFSSTAAVYGEPARQPIEEDDATRPQSPYGETKLAFEHALRWHARAARLRAVSLRYFNAAGASQRSGERHDPETHLIPLVLRAAAGQGPAVTVLGTDYATPDGTCVRDYVHVVDVAQAHVLALRSLAAAPGDAPPFAVYNVGCGGRGYSVRQVIDAAREVTGRDVPVRLGPRRPGDPAVLLASAARIREQLGWRPAFQDLRAIIASAWAWMQGQAP